MKRPLHWRHRTGSPIRSGHWHVMNKAKKARREARYGPLPSE